MFLLTSNITEELTDAVDNVIKPSVLQEYFSDLPSKALSIGLRILLSVIVFIVGYNLIKLIRKIIKKGMDRAHADKGVITFIDSFIKVALCILLVIIIAEIFGYDAAGLSALIASAGVTVGLALQGSLSNLAGGVLILLTKPFTVGDYIIDAGTSKEGTVKEIHICYTKLLTFDNQVVILPNGNLANNAITNVTKEDTRRIDVNVSIAYSANIDDARKVLMKMLEEDKAVLKDKDKCVVVNKLNDSGVDLIVRFWVKGSDYWTSLYRINENTKKALDRAGIEIPFPQMDVHMKQ